MFFTRKSFIDYFKLLIQHIIGFIRNCAKRTAFRHRIFWLGIKMNLRLHLDDKWNNKNNNMNGPKKNQMKALFKHACWFTRGVKRDTVIIIRLWTKPDKPYTMMGSGELLQYKTFGNVCVALFDKQYCQVLGKHWREREGER